MNNKPFNSRLARAAMTLMIAAAPLQWSLAQVTLNTPKTTLGTVIKKIQKQSKYKFFYDDRLASEQVNAVRVKDADIRHVLKQLFNGKGITYTVADNVIYLKREIPSQKRQPQRQVLPSP